MGKGVQMTRLTVDKNINKQRKISRYLKLGKINTAPNFQEVKIIKK